MDKELIISNHHRETILDTIAYLVLLKNEIQESRDKIDSPLFKKTMKSHYTKVIDDMNVKLFNLRDLIDRLDEIVRV